jgi:PAS domain S-box-containing protein
MAADRSKKKKLEQLHRRMIQEITDYAIVLLDIDGTVLSWNKGVEKIKGYAAEEIIGKNFREFYIPEARTENLPEKLLALAAKEGKARHIGKRLRKDGTTFWGSVLITAIYDENNEVVGFTKLTRELQDHETS